MVKPPCRRHTVARPNPRFNWGKCDTGALRGLCSFERWLKAFEYYLVYNDSNSVHDVISCHVSSLNEFASLSLAVSGCHSSVVSTPFAVQARNARLVTPAYTYAYIRLRLQVPLNHMLAEYRGGWGSRTLSANGHIRMEQVTISFHRTEKASVPHSAQALTMSAAVSLHHPPGEEGIHASSGASLCSTLNCEDLSDA